MSIFESLAGRAIWSGVAASIQSIRGHAITITSPGPQETLSGAEISGVNKYFPIRGALKVLPKELEIWLLVQDESTGLVWPQGFFPVQFNHQLGTWMGQINGSGRKQVRIYAMVAPPTSQECGRERSMMIASGGLSISAEFRRRTALSPSLQTVTSTGMLFSCRALLMRKTSASLSSITRRWWSASAMALPLARGRCLCARSFSGGAGSKIVPSGSAEPSGTPKTGHL